MQGETDAPYAISSIFAYPLQPTHFHKARGIMEVVQSEQVAQLAAANDVLQRCLERLAQLSDVRLLVSEVLTSIIEVTGAAGGALLRYEPSTQIGRAHV